MLPLSYDGVKRGYLDRQGRIVVDSRSDEVYPMTEWGTFVKDHGLLGFVNRKGEYIIHRGAMTFPAACSMKGRAGDPEE